MSELDFGYMDSPANGLGIVRSRTLLGNLRVWDIPRHEESLYIVIKDIGHSPIPGLYMLFDEKSRKVYIGQTENLKNRLMTHMSSPEDKISNWSRAVIINDARNASQSDLNDENIRLTLETFLVRLFKINRYQVTTSSSRKPSLSATQRTLIESFKKEIILLLTRKSKISKVLTERGDDEVYNDEVRNRLLSKGYKINKWSKHEAEMGGEKIFLRPGSAKPKGWQITFRGNKSGSFKKSLEEGKGYLLVPRGPILLIPLVELKNFIEAEDCTAFERDTIDVFLRFGNDKIVVIYKGSEKDITSYAI